MELKPREEQTEIEGMAADWVVRPLGDLIRSVEYGSSARSKPSGAVPVLRMGNIQDGKIDWDDLVFTDIEAEVRKYQLRRGDVLFNRTNTVDLVGKAAIYDTDRIAIFAGYLIRIEVAPDRLEPHFLNYILNTEFARRYGRTVLSLAVGQANINGEKLKTYPIPTPPTLAEQQAIATALSDVDALLEGLDRLVAKKRDLKHAAMQQLLTGHARLPGFHGEWKMVTMRQALTQNATYGIVTAGNFVQSGVRMLRGGDIADGSINTDLPMVTREKAAEYARTCLAKDDVVIALVGYPGASAKIPEELIGANISRAVGLLRLNGRILADFLVCFLNSPDGRRMVLAPSAGSAQQVVNLAALNKLQFSVPPLPEQAAIAEVLMDMELELAALGQRREKTQALKQAMMQELLTGKTRLVTPEVIHA